MDKDQPDARRSATVPGDPGFIYIIEHSNRYKIGRSKSKSARIKAAKIWLPDMKIIGIKPFWDITQIERNLHEGFSRCWYDHERIEIIDEGYRDVLIEEFTAFSDTDRDKN